MKTLDPAETSRAQAFELWMKAPMPMVTFFRTIDIARAIRHARKKRFKLNMLLCWHIGYAAQGIREFFVLPVGDRLVEYDNLAVNTIVLNRKGEVSSCDIPFTDDIGKFNESYLKLTSRVAANCQNHDLTDSMVIGTSNLAKYEIDGAVGIYSGIYNNPFLIWGKYKKGLFKTTLTLSFQFHHTQMDGAQAAKFLQNIQDSIKDLD